jgi:hypothetical protein
MEAEAASGGIAVHESPASAGLFYAGQFWNIFMKIFLNAH